MTNDDTFDFRDCIGQYRLYCMVRRLNPWALASCVCFIAVRITAMTFGMRTADLLEQAATLCGTQGEATNASNVAFGQSNDALEQYMRINAVQLFMQAAAVLLVFASFILFFPACIIMFHRVEKKVVSYIHEMDLRPDNGIVFSLQSFQARVKPVPSVIKLRCQLGRPEQCWARCRQPLMRRRSAIFYVSP